MADKQEELTKVSWQKKKTIGSGIFWLGFSLLVIGLVSLPIARGSGDISSGIIASIVFLIGTIIGGILAVVGVFLFLVGWNGGQIQKHRNADRSQSE